MLLGAAVAIMASVIGLRLVVAPDQPRFADALAAEEGDEPFVPEAVGAEFQVSGDRAGNFSLTREVGPPGYGLGGDDGRMHFQGAGEDLAIAQFSYDGLDFFPKEGDCTITPGVINSARGVAAARISCPGFRDIRDTATITLEGWVGLPAAMVAELDLPDIGGSVTVGDETWQVTDGRFLVFGSRAVATEGPSMSISGEEFMFEFGVEEGLYSLERIHHGAATSDVPPGACSVTTEQVGAASPDAILLEVSIECDQVRVEGLGEVPIQGSAVVEQLTFQEP